MHDHMNTTAALPDIAAYDHVRYVCNKKNMYGYPK